MHIKVNFFCSIHRKNIYYFLDIFFLSVAKKVSSDSTWHLANYQLEYSATFSRFQGHFFKCRILRRCLLEFGDKVWVSSISQMGDKWASFHGCQGGCRASSWVLAVSRNPVPRFVFSAMFLNRLSACLSILPSARLPVCLSIRWSATWRLVIRCLRHGRRVCRSLF